MQWGQKVVGGWALMALVSALLVVPGAVVAHEGHDHDKPTPLALPVAPRVVAITPDYELVGVRSGQTRLTLFLTRYATNEPVENARLSIEVGDRRVEAQGKGGGVFEASAPWLDSRDGLDLTFQLVDGDNQDLLAGTLEPSGSAAQAAPTELQNSVLRTEWLLFAAGVICGLVVGLFAFKLFSRRAAPSQSDTGATAAEANASGTETVKHLRRAVALLIFLVMPLLADGVHAADRAAGALPSIPSTMTTDLPQRLPDGTLFVPKATQHLLSLRTVVVAEGQTQISRELAGTIIAAPSGFGRVQSPHSGRLDAPESGLAYVGQRVKKGDRIATLTPHLETLERGNVASQIAETDARISMQKTRLARLRGAPLAVPPIKIDEAEGELEALQQKRNQLSPTLQHRYEIRAPISGVVSRAGYFAGQIVGPRDVLFEIVDPTEFWIEAFAYAAPDFAPESAATVLIAGQEPHPATYVGRGLTLKEQAAPLMFKLMAATDGLSIGQPAKVVVTTPSQVKGFAVPASSIVRTDNGMAAVWIKTEAERFEAQIVKVEPVDGHTVVISAGLKPDTRIVMQGATLLSQVR